jgi:hypothetical protein
MLIPKMHTLALMALLSSVQKVFWTVQKLVQKRKSGGAMALSDDTFTCDECGLPYKWLSHHYSNHPDCRPPDLNSDSEDDDDELPVLQSESAARVSQDTTREWVASDLADLRHEHGLQETAIEAVKEFVLKCQRASAARAASQLVPAMKLGVDRASVVSTISSAADTIFDRLETAKQELSEMRRGVPYLEPRLVDLGEQDIVCSFSISDLIERKLQHDSAYRKACIDKSQSWKVGDKWRTPSTTDLNDFDDGTAARYHPHLMRPANADEEFDLRIAIDLNADDVEALP